MLQKKLSRTSKLLTLSLLLLPARPLQADAEHNFLVGTALAAIGFMAWGFLKIFKSSGHATAQRRLDETRKELKTASRFEELSKLVPHGYETEHHLQTVAHNLPLHTPANEVIRQLSNTLENLQKDKNFVRQSLPDWSNDNYYADLTRQATEIERAIDAELLKLDLLHSYLTKHRAYFQLIRTCEQIRTSYQDEITACSNKLTVYQDQEIKKIALTKDLNASNGFPLITYIDRLEPKSKEMESQLASLPHNPLYQGLLHEANLLRTRLNHIKQTIAQDQEFQRQRTEYARFQQDERLVQARLKEVEELSRKNRLEEERIREDRRKYDLHHREVKAHEERAQHARHIAQHMPSLENLFLEVQRAIRQQKRIIAELQEQITRSSSISPQCAEYEELRREIHAQERKLEELYAELDRLLSRVKREI